MNLSRVDFFPGLGFGFDERSFDRQLRHDCQVCWTDIAEVLMQFIGYGKHIFPVDDVTAQK